SRSTIYDRLNPKSKRYDPSFPKPLRLGESAIGWQLSEILIWIGDRQPVISNMQHKD
ncbi:TPA: AlpA family phage regulatory protein, partial [Aeromonas veronii bv. veronii]|nr:AlpA family phage regulatory protein [Aeromonas veronii bv. veronii]